MARYDSLKMPKRMAKLIAEALNRDPGKARRYEALLVKLGEAERSIVEFLGISHSTDLGDAIPKIDEYLKD